MPTTLTDNLALNLPEVGASRDTWGALLNENFTTLDGAVSAAMPIGSVIDFAGPNAPAGWLRCDGRLISRTTYSDLFAAIGTTWGAGDGSTTFALPNTLGRSSVAAGTVTDSRTVVTTFTLGQITGAVSEPITQANLPIITLTASAGGDHNHGSASGAGGAHAHGTDAQGQHNHNYNTSTANNDHSHTGYTNSQGAHTHNVYLPNSGAGVAPGAYSAMSTVFGSSNYVTNSQGTHSHTIQTYGASVDHVHAITADGTHAHTTDTAANHTHPISNSGTHTHSVPLGGANNWLSVLSPLIVFTKIIYAGQQATTRALAAVTEPTSARRLLAAPMRGSH